MINTYVFDLDGTLADGNGRDFYNPSNEEILKDLPIKPIVQIAQSLLHNGFNLVFLSGREDKYQDVTSKWISTHLGVKEPVLFMRKTKDQRKDAIIKLEIFNEHIKPNYNVLAVVDDRMQVCKMWYEQKIFCINVNQGLIEY
jgi:phosphoglycolate phosphatase-like HAD superfamily hydrolase